MSRCWVRLLQIALVWLVASVLISDPTGVAASCALPASRAAESAFKQDSTGDHPATQVGSGSPGVDASHNVPSDPCGKAQQTPKNDALTSPLHLSIAGVLPDRVPAEFQRQPQHVDARQLGNRGASPPPESPPPQS